MDKTGFFILFAACFLASLVGTRLVLALARKKALLDHPVERSSHKLPTPHGGGLAVSGVLLLSWGYSGLVLSPVGIAVLAAAFVLAALSFVDDIKPLPPLLRFAAQGIAVAVCLYFMEAPKGYLGGVLPLWLDLLIAGLGWLWFVNAYNFMDGIDGMAGGEAASIGFGFMVLSLFGVASPHFMYLGVAVLGAALGFLWWNWAPAKIFMGDVGSIPLGFLLGFALLSLAAQGQVIPALILPLYFLADSTIAFGRRLVRGEKVWTPHRLHFYQKAVDAGLSHSAVMKPILAVNVTLIGLSLVAAVDRPWVALVTAIALVGALLRYLASRTPS